MFRNLGYKLERIFRNPGLIPCEKKTLKLALLDNQEFIFPAVTFTTEKKKMLLKTNYFWYQIYCYKGSIKTCVSKSQSISTALKIQWNVF